MDRVDLLASDPGTRYGALTGRILDADPDEALQAIVEEAARELMCPIAAISLVLEHTQMFRAQVGMAPDLAAGIDRDVSFCQWVLHDTRPVVVEELRDHALMPQRAVDGMGVRAYAGAPVRVNGFIVGTLCVMDTKPRSFGTVDLASIIALADSASERLEELAAPAHAIVRSSTGRALADLRKSIVPLRSDIARARVLAADAEAPARAARNGSAPHALLTRSPDAAAELAAVLRDIETTSAVLEEDATLLELALSEDDGGTSLNEVVAFADGLARRTTCTRGGVRWPPLEKAVAVRASRHVAAGVLAATLSEVAMRQDNEQGTDAYIRVDPSFVSIHLDADLDRDRAEACAHAVGELLGAHPNARVEAAGPLVVVRLLRAYDC